MLFTSRKASKHPTSPTLLTGQKSDRLQTPGALIPTFPISPSCLSSHLPTGRDEAGGHAWGPTTGGTHSPGGSWKLAGSWMVAVGGPLGTTSGRGPPAATARTAGAPAEGAEGAGQPGTLAAGLPHAGAGPPAEEPAGGCSGCPPGISLTGAAAAAAGALMEKEKEKVRGAAGSRRAPRRPAASLSDQALPRPAARRPAHMVTPPPTAQRPHVGPASPAGGRERGRAEGGPGPPARPTAAAPSPALPQASQGPRPAAARRVYSAMRRTRRRSGSAPGRAASRGGAGGIPWRCGGLGCAAALGKQPRPFMALPVTR